MAPSPRIEAAAERSPLVREALAVASDAHAGQIRNGSGGMAYIEHPIAVADLLARHGFAEPVLAAALLHDVLEDSDVAAAELRERFGEEVSDMVEALSDDEAIDDYRERKREHRGRVAGADGGALAIYAADKLTNAATLRAAYEREGPRVADEFKVPLGLKLEVWEADAQLVRQRAPGVPFLDELDAELSRLRADLGAAAPRRGI